MLFPQDTVISAFNLYPRYTVLLHLIPQDTEFLVHIQPKHSGFRRGGGLTAIRNELEKNNQNYDCFPFFCFYFPNSIEHARASFNHSFFSLPDFLRALGLENMKISTNKYS